MGFLTPCRHGNYPDECVVCAADRTTRAIEDQTRQQKTLADQEAERRRKERAAQVKRERRQARIDAEERATAQARRDLAGIRNAERHAAESRAELEQQRQAEEHDSERRIAATDRIIAEARAQKEEEKRRRLEEDRVRWRGQYKHRTGETDDEIIEAAWLDHRRREELRGELDRQHTELRRIAEGIDAALRALVKRSAQGVGLPRYGDLGPEPDNSKAKALAEQFNSLSRWSFKRGRLLEQVKEADRAFTLERVQHSRARAANTCWEALSAGVATLRSLWPHHLIDWEALVDEGTVSAVADIPPIGHELVEIDLRHQGLDHANEIFPVVHLLRTIDSLFTQAETVDNLVTEIFEAEGRSRGL